MDNSNVFSIKAISLFSGMGGDSVGIKNAGINLVAYSEKEKKFRESHDLNFPNISIIGDKVNSDITKIKDDEFLKYKNQIKLIFAGFPCQGFSTAGKKKSNDPRNTLFREFVRAAKLIEPDIIIGENVKGLLSRKTDTGEEYVKVIKEEFEKLNYSVIHKVFKCHEYGVPQKRERLIILGIKTDKLAEYNLEFPEPTNEPVHLKDIVNFNMKGAIKMSNEIFESLNIPNECILTDMNNEEEENNPHPYLKSKLLASGDNLKYQGKEFSNLFSFSKRGSPIHCEIIDIRKPSKTIICTYEHQPRLFVPIKNKNGYYLRTLLSDELKQIQGFPSDYQIFGNEKERIIQIGNAVPPPLIEKIIKHILIQ
jgi:DNA (cytosine-5)-methyltransferase 1